MSKALKARIADIRDHLFADPRSRFATAFPEGDWVDDQFRMPHPADAALRYVVFPDRHWELHTVDGVLIRTESGEPILGHNMALLFKRMYSSASEKDAAYDLAGRLGLPLGQNHPKP
jgi:hypothetical protein